jgi:hypothetical protein
MEQHLVKVAAAVVVETHGLSVDHRIVRMDAMGDLLCELREPLENDAASRHELISMDDVRQRSESIVFQLEQPIGMIERLL